MLFPAEQKRSKTVKMHNLAPGQVQYSNDAKLFCIEPFLSHVCLYFVPLSQKPKVMLTTLSLVVNYTTKFTIKVVLSGKLALFFQQFLM